MAEVLLLVALKTDQPNIKQRVRSVLTAAEPNQPDGEAVVWAKAVEDLVAADLDALALSIGWDAVSRLRVGDVVASDLPTAETRADATDAPSRPEGTVACPGCADPTCKCLGPTHSRPEGSGDAG